MTTEWEKSIVRSYRNAILHQTDVAESNHLAAMHLHAVHNRLAEFYSDQVKKIVDQIRLLAMILDDSHVPPQQQTGQLEGFFERVIKMSCLANQHEQAAEFWGDYAERRPEERTVWPFDMEIHHAYRMQGE